MTCAKQTVRCVLTNASGLVSGLGSNWCDSGVDVCPRAPGEGYEKCQTVCNQDGHAEIQALRYARLRGYNLTGGTAYISGHYHVCEPCARALRDAGITTLVIRQEHFRRD